MWIRKAYPTVTNKTKHVQLGVHIEEFSELLTEIAPFQKTQEHDGDTLEAITSDLEVLASQLKQGLIQLDLNSPALDRIKVLDALCDLIVTSVAVSHVFGFDIVGALTQVCASNESKFDDEGNPIFDANGKVMKGPKYFKPVLDDFI